MRRRLAALPLLAVPILALAAALTGADGVRTAGAVAAADPLAVEAGFSALRAGGNAADAAVAVALALAVVHPEAGNLGGGGFAVIRQGGEVRALDFRETAPAGATRDMFLAPDRSPVPERSLVGPLAAGVPGSPAGLYELHRACGRLPWRDVVAPAIDLARRGFPVGEHLSRSIEDKADLLSRFRETSRIWLPRGHAPRPGTVMRLPILAGTLEAYARRGPRAILEGPAAEAIVRASRRHGGILTARDLAAYEPVWREPIRFEAFGWEIASMPLPSSGGILLGETLGLVERLGYDEIPRDDAARGHLLVEAWRRAFADRFLLGDPATTRASAAALLAPARLDALAAGVPRERASLSRDAEPGSLLPGAERRETTHLSVVDGDGDAVAMTVTLNGNFGCGLLVPEVGFLLNNEMDDFATAPGRPNLWGLVQGEANAVAPGKRMLSSMAPTIAWRGRDVLVLGSPGGSHIPTATAQVLLNVVVDGDRLSGAVERPRIHHQWLPDEVAAEPAWPDEARRALEALGHRVVEEDRIGEVHAVRRRADGTIEAAADPRGPGASGVEPGRRP